MRIIISPAKKMNIDTDSLDYYQLPQFIQEAEIILAYLKDLTYDEAKSIWNCNDKIAILNYQRIKEMDLYTGLTPAILSYEGLQYQHMAPGVFKTGELEYIQKYLRIMSGFYGILRPLDGILPYRLEMQAKLKGFRVNSLYNFWSNKLAQQLFSESKCILNLASKEYSKCISKYLDNSTEFITCVFGEKIENKVIEKGTRAKMARGEMVRYMAENQIDTISDIRGFDRLNFLFSKELSNDETYVFISGES